MQKQENKKYPKDSKTFPLERFLEMEKENLEDVSIAPDEKNGRPKKRRKDKSKPTCEISCQSTDENEEAPAKYKHSIQQLQKVQKIADLLTSDSSTKQVGLYRKLLKYVLTDKELAENGFPHYSPNNPEEVICNSSPYYKSDESLDPQTRLCIRCSKVYVVTDDGQYFSSTTCRYHCSRLRSNGEFSCCGSRDSTGCVSCQHHVSVKTKLETVQYVSAKEALDEQIYALDCEMCFTVKGFEVTRVSIVSTNGTTIYDSYVLPESPVTDFNTFYSGVTPSHLENTITTLRHVQLFLMKLLSSNTILVGHGIENDLKALRVVHNKVIDTSVLFPHHSGFPLKRSLKSLAANILHKSIRSDFHGHDSVEDARTCMELVLAAAANESSCLQQAFQPHPLHVSSWPNINFIPYVSCNVGYWLST